MSSLVHATSDEIGMGFFPIIFVNQSLRDHNLKMLGPKDGFWKYNLNLIFWRAICFMIGRCCLILLCQERQ